MNEIIINKKSQKQQKQTSAIHRDNMRMSKKGKK